MPIPRPWLPPHNIPDLRRAVPADLPPLPQPVDYAAVKAVAVGENNDPLIPVPDTLDQEHLYLQLGSELMPRIMYLRQEVVTRLLKAQGSLPPGFRFVLLDTWRTVDAQRELMRIYLEEDPNLGDGYVSDADDSHVHAPHTTGGAVDLTLSYHGCALRMGADFDEFAPTAHFLALEDISPTADAETLLARDLRRLLAKVLIDASFAPLSQEWWHFSYGDQRWAAHYGLPESLYSTCLPDVDAKGGGD
ncbi:MAG: M15 family metallopeptidase [Corynebacterium sp.]|nr:M15 family metallopeptidase [Corynebacterium sp.]